MVVQKTDRRARRPVALDLAVAYAVPRTGLPAATSFRQWTAAVLQGKVKRAELALRLVDADEGQALNRQYRGKDYPTNVLSFPAELPPGLPPEMMSALGDIVICAPVVQREALAQGKRVRDHYAHLTVHGVLHLLGYDHEHPTEAEAMETLERQILAGLGFSDPY
jgi:probable rRNA maturation factor